MRFSPHRSGWPAGHTLTRLVLVALFAGSPACERDPRLALVPSASGSGSGSAVVQGAAPELERRGAVLTILTRVGPSAPAGTRDQVALVRVSLTSGAARAQLDIPIEGGGVLALGQAEDDGVVLVELLDPRRQTVGHNYLDVEQLRGSIGILALEVASATPAWRGCPECSEPESLTEVRGLVDTNMYWSAVSDVVDTAQGEPFYVATRVDASSPERRDLFEAVGAHVLDAHLDEGQGLIWTLVRPVGPQTAVDVAVALAPRALIKGFALARGSQWPRLWVPR